MNRRERRAAQKNAGFRASPTAATLASAFRAHQAGHRSEAERMYRDVLAVEPRNAAALHLLGALMHQTGKSDEAISLMRQAIAIEPRNPDYHYNLGSVLNAAGHRTEAIASLSKAIELKPQYVEAHFELGNALGRAGEFESAEKALRRAHDLQPNNATILNNLGRVLRGMSRIDDALALWQRAVTIQPSLAVAHLNIGLVHREQNRLDEAERCFRRVLEIDPRDPVAQVQLAAVLLSQNRADDGFPFAEQALSAQENNDTRVTYVRCLAAVSRFNPSAELRERLRRALVEAWVSPNEIAALCASVLRAHPVLGPAITRVAEQWPQAAPRQQHPVLSDIEFAATEEPLFRAYLEMTPNCDIGIEFFLTALRGNLLERSTNGQEAMAGLLNVCAALARQCFINDYVFNEFASETSRVEQLSAAALTAIRDAAPLSPFQLAALAMYRPLHSLSNAARLLDRDWPEPVAGILRQQVLEPIEEAALRESTRTLVAIEGSSGHDREPFEDTAYPRWTETVSTLTPRPIREILRERLPAGDVPDLEQPASPHVLIAGCGTGLQAIIAAQSYGDAKIVAVDPSLAKLAYARRQAARLNCGTVEFVQSDIASLPTADWRFDVIESGGMLHDLPDPRAGLQALTTMLRPGGVMRLALHSDIGRSFTKAAREFAAAGNYQPDAEGVRLCRQAILRLPADAKARDVLQTADFYSTGTCRDLVLAPRERSLTLPEIGEFLSGSGLTFLGFETSEAVRNAFASRFPDPAARKDLTAWHQFETDQPQTFAAMYVFWVHRPA